jgi:ABC-type transport system substrate-binding protein
MLLTACGGSGNQQASGTATKAPDDQQIYILPISGKSDVKTLDPALAYDIASINTVQQLFTGLVQFDDNLKVKDQLAASHQVAADGVYNQNADKNDMNYGQNHSQDNRAQQAVQQLLVQADANADQASRLQQYNEAEQKLINDVVAIPMYQETSTYILKPCVVGVIDNAQQITPPDDWGKIYISTATPCSDVNKYK